MATKLIGTAANQVPTNGSLGSLAFQDKESVRVDNLTVDNSVGIGTIIPSDKLDVRGAGTTTIAVRTTDTSGTTIGRVRVDYTGGGGGTPSQVDLRAGSNYTYLISPTNTPMLFGTNNTERMRIDSSGNVGIGTAAPLSTAGYGWLTINGASQGGIVSLSNADTELGRLQSSSLSTTLSTLTAVPLVFKTNNAESMRISSAGAILVGKSAASVTTNGVELRDDFLNVFTNRDGIAAQFRRVATTSLQVAQFYGGADANTIVGSVSVTDAATAYNTSSDYRLKEDVQPMVGASDRVMALNPVNFSWKTNGSRVDGFLAHEAQEVVPEAVTGEKDAVDADGNPEYQGIDQSKLVPVLTAALQEALTKIEALEARIVALETA